MEYVSKIDIFGLQILDKSGIWKPSMRKAFFENYILLHKRKRFCKKITNSVKKCPTLRMIFFKFVWPSQNIWILIRRKKNYKVSRIRDAYLHKVSSLRFFSHSTNYCLINVTFFGHRFGFSKSILEIKTQNVKHLLTCCLRLSELLTDVNAFSFVLVRDHSCIT